MSAIIKRPIVIGTRDSALALWQTNWVLGRLKELFPEQSFEVKAIKTKGDKILDVALAKIGDKGLFTKELEVAMLEGEIDMAVHSLKDMPTQLPEGLVIGAICEREDCRDVFISPSGTKIEDLPEGAKVATSSLRRKSQLWKWRPDLELVDIRGNLQTRMRKLEEQKLDGLILAAAGVIRLGWADKITQYIPTDLILPAVGQGSITIEMREGDEEIASFVAPLNHEASALAIRAERALMRKLEGGCQVPIGALGSLQGQGENRRLVLNGLVASLDGRNICQEQIEGNTDEPEEIGLRLAERLLQLGAREILNDVRQESKQ
ncbi:hydroxymethylbilane synthase [Heliorestis acidaminivorans]|uniref:Porphobilinogen deaminase n=1 Tax=Heliorestis acidaminivorans TaxID=553427 RepID=A0A6I0EXS2_9FIRM|nr:hydroxymethylbilane synthase [Heliorestis acidaminivorans]KAB2954599.1 hydroxymethylbilane synthase [Heliorestis acidaminivorans]